MDEIMQGSVLPRGGQPKNDSFGTGRIDAMLCIANTPPAGPTHDIAMGAVLAPADKIDPMTPLAPMVVVRNRGTYHETSITFHCKVESLGTQVYSDQYVLSSLDSAQTDTVTFPNWNVGPGSQTYDLTFWHTYLPDTNHHNDTCMKTTVTRGHDVSVAGMNIGGRVRANTPFTPRTNLASTDYTETGFEAWCIVDSSGTVVYEDSTTIDSVPAGGSRSFPFPSAWSVGPVGAAYTATMYHNCGPDQNRTNDTLSVATTASDQVRVLMCYADAGTPDSLVAGLVAMGDSVTTMDVSVYTPTLGELQAYDAVGTQSNFQYADPVGFGNVLADYVDAGGGVVIGQFSFSTGWAMAGRIMTGAYATITAGVNTSSTTQLGWYNPGHPTMSGVSAVGEYYAASGPFVGESVAVWQDGRPYVGVSSNQKVVGLNQYPGNYVYSERTGDWVLVWHNSFMYVAGSGSGVGGFDPFAPALNVTLSATPNPVLGPRAEVNYTVPAAGKVSLYVFDLNGRLVKTLVNGNAKPGVNRVIWNLADNTGRQVSSGVYFCKLVAGSKTQSRKVVVR
ncbi:MAG: T9SS type A sorting domain-containing protein [candidate division WOR-3 bacterium]|nr:T9SS type A sorting domain-containing protein [candidate division WOR-3 bacterium]